MKNFIQIIFVVLLVGSCSDMGVESHSSGDIIGKWYNFNTTFVFNSDHAFIDSSFDASPYYRGLTMVIHGNYTTTNNILQRTNLTVTYMDSALTSPNTNRNIYYPFAIKIISISDSLVLKENGTLLYRINGSNDELWGT